MNRIENAVTVSHAMDERIEQVMTEINDALGFDAWSRILDDHVWAYAFCVPEAVYEDRALCYKLEGYLRSMFCAAYMTLSVGEWRASSADEDWPENSRYDVDWLGSRHRSVHIGPHYYVEPMPMRMNGQPYRLARPAPKLPLWHTRTSEPDEGTVIVRTTPVADAAALADEVRKEEMRRLVFMDATTEAWSRWRGQRIFVAANCQNERPWNDQYDWHVVGAIKTSDAP
jgi:hypothetical protein